jgi:hypothetical protein
MSIDEKKKHLSGLRQTHGEIASQLADATDGTRKHALLHDLHYHLGHVIEISEELLVIEAREVPPDGVAR